MFIKYDGPVDEDFEDLEPIFENWYKAHNIEYPQLAVSNCCAMVRFLFSQFGIKIFEFRKGIYILKISVFLLLRWKRFMRSLKAMSTMKQLI